jgi:GTP-binding protein HflX
VDITHENAIEQSQTVNDVLVELGAADKPRVTALNKVDRLGDPGEVDTTLFPNAVPISAVTGFQLQTLLFKVSDVIAASLDSVHVLVPFERGDLVEVFHRRGRVASERPEIEGTLIEGQLPHALVALFEPYRILNRRISRPGAQC